MYDDTLKTVTFYLINPVDMFPHTTDCFLKPFLACRYVPLYRKTQTKFYLYSKLPPEQDSAAGGIIAGNLYLSHFEAFIQKLHVTSRLHTQRALSVQKRCCITPVPPWRGSISIKANELFYCDHPPTIICPTIFPFKTRASTIRQITKIIAHNAMRFLLLFLIAL